MYKHILELCICIVLFLTGCTDATCSQSKQLERTGVLSVIAVYNQGMETRDK